MESLSALDLRCLALYNCAISNLSIVEVITARVRVALKQCVAKLEST